MIGHSHPDAANLLAAVNVVGSSRGSDALPRQPARTSATSMSTSGDGFARAIDRADTATHTSQISFHDRVDSLSTFALDNAKRVA